MNDSEHQSDGTGAQIQRQFANFALSQLIGANYSYNPVQRVAVHPLDPFQTKDEYEKFLARLNEFISFPSDFLPPESQLNKIHLKNPSFYDLFRNVLFSNSKSLDTVLLINEPYKIIEYFPDSYQGVARALGKSNKTSKISAQKEIVVHYRQGVGGMAIYPGQAIPREISLNYFVGVIKGIQSENIGVQLSLTIYTDAPAKQLAYSPPEDQKFLWDGSPNFDGTKMHVKAFDFSDMQQLVGLEPRILSGGDPIDAIIGMSQADFLVMARSSLSYVAAILNEHGQVYYPPDFWHKPMGRWLPGEKILKSNYDASK